MDSELTDEQRERIRKNRERALEIQRQKKKRKLEQEQQETKEKTKNKKEESAIGGGGGGNIKTTTNSTHDTNKQEKNAASASAAEVAVELEDFENGASEWVTKKEAMGTYCLPEGTLAVCHYEERENPHHKGWKPMKLYKRSEIRERARKRFGGLEGLIKERNKRQSKKFAKDMKIAETIFN